MVFSTTPFIILIFLRFISGSQEKFTAYSIMLLSIAIVMGVFGIRTTLVLLYKSEVIIIYRDKMILFERFFSNRGKKVMEKKDVKDLRYRGSVKSDKIHFNFWIAGNKNLAFFYKDMIHRFGKGDWEEKGVELIKNFRCYDRFLFLN